MIQESQVMSWQETNHTLVRSWQFNDFASAWAFAQKVTPLFDAHNHHPDMLVGWGKVTITTTTHDAGSRVTDKDWALAKAIDKVSHD